MRPFKKSVATRIPDERVTRVLPTLRTCPTLRRVTSCACNMCLAPNPRHSEEAHLESRRGLDVIPVLLGEGVYLLLSLALLTLTEALVLPAEHSECTSSSACGRSWHHVSAGKLLRPHPSTRPHPGLMLHSTRPRRCPHPLGACAARRPLATCAAAEGRAAARAEDAGLRAVAGCRCRLGRMCRCLPGRPPCRPAPPPAALRHPLVQHARRAGLDRPTGSRIKPPRPRSRPTLLHSCRLCKYHAFAPAPAAPHAPLPPRRRSELTPQPLLLALAEARAASALKKTLRVPEQKKPIVPQKLGSFQNPKETRAKNMKIGLVRGARQERVPCRHLFRDVTAV